FDRHGRADAHVAGSKPTRLTSPVILSGRCLPVVHPTVREQRPRWGKALGAAGETLASPRAWASSRGRRRALALGKQAGSDAACGGILLSSERVHSAVRRRREWGDPDGNGVARRP